ncbi:BspA family leucine-rich repeat surface protein [Ruminococcus sp.]|uniref:BspA family leucine-rich repeat surface protein n=1 Tax=Ruminococcus sp. TaxID=41978 RepID=UPI0025E25DD0|nr:BspA family leucine-rich repeat surface protein [Ruminococcus sp.]
MKNKHIGKALAAVMAFALIGGALPTGNTSLFGSPSVAKAETSKEIVDSDHDDDPDHLNYDPASFSEKTGVLLLNGRVNKNDVRQYFDNEKLTKVSCAKGTIFPADCSNMFYHCDFDEIDLTNADTSNVNDMSYMFCNCDNLESLDLSMLNTSNVKTMRCMFMGNKLTSVNLKNIDTSSVTNMYGMFWDCKNLTSLDLSCFDTSNVETMIWMFCDCKALESIDISSFDTSKVEDMTQMFANCYSLTSLDVRSFDTSNVKLMPSMFSNCTSLESIDVSNFDTTKARYNCDGTFFDCPALIPNMVFNFGANITLDGSLGVNFYIDQPEYYSQYYSGDLGKLSKNLAKVVLSGPNGDIVITDFEKYDTNTQTMKLTYPVNATQANEKITLKAYDKDGNRLVVCDQGYGLCSHSQLECSVQSYINSLKESSSYKNDTKLQLLVDALENYCKAADRYFNGTSNDVKKYTDEYADLFDQYATKLPDDVKLSLVLNSETALRIYTDSNDVFIGSTKAEAKYKNGEKYYEISNIPAHLLSTAYKVTIDGQKYECSALSYAYRAIKNNASGNLKDVVLALYFYSLAADAYIA